MEYHINRSGCKFEFWSLYELGAFIKEKKRSFLVNFTKIYDYVNTFLGHFPGP